MRKYRKFVARYVWIGSYVAAVVSLLIGEPLLGRHLWRWAVAVAVVLVVARLDWWRARRARAARRRRREERRRARESRAGSR